jgi:hypothetical protein
MTKQPIVVHMIKFAGAAVFLLATISATSQTAISLNDLSAFKNPGKTWKLVGKVGADLNENNILQSSPGTGILINMPGKKETGVELSTIEDFSDMDLELDYMMAKNSSSGIYLQGKYKILLNDSWGIPNINTETNGGIFERQAPRQNVSRAPGLWQHVKIAFQAPKFDASGNKTENAKIIRIELNGIIIHENVELKNTNEVAAGPLVFQGGGAIAFRNIHITKYNGLPPVFADIHYSVYYSKHETIPNFATMKADDEGMLYQISTAFLKNGQEFVIRYTGNIIIKTASDYIFQRETYGKGFVKINNTVVSDITSSVTTPVKLEPGTYPFEIIYLKPVGWLPASLGLTVSAPKIREFLMSDETSLYREYPDPIIISASDNIVHRSFMDIPDGPRVVHSANVGSPKQLHYSFDMDNGTVYQLWRGNFLDATAMWNGRGDGSSTPIGSRLLLSMPKQSILQLNTINDSVSKDTLFTTKGYEIDKQKNTTFRYTIHGAEVKDLLEVSGNGDALKRTITISNNPGNLYMNIAEGKVIENSSKGWYTIDDHSYYIRIDNAESVPVIKNVNGCNVLIAPIKNTISYSILY